MVKSFKHKKCSLSEINLYRVWALLELAHRHMAEIREKELKSLNLSFAQMRTLNAIARLDAVGKIPTPWLISKQLLRAPSTITQALNQLEKRGLIVRVRDQKKKSIIRLELTESGLHIYQTARNTNALTKIFSNLPPRKIENLESYLEILFKAAQMDNQVNDPLWW